MSGKWHMSRESCDRGKHGKDFERDVSTLLFKRVIDANFQTFHFTREKIGVGKFDDIVVITEKEERRREIWLAQLKHKQNENAKIDFEELGQNKDSDFYLPKYFDYYVESKTSISNDSDFDDAKLQTLYMVTNRVLDDNLKDINTKKVTNDPFFETDVSLVKLNIPDNLKRYIFSQSYLTTRQRLATELLEYFICDSNIDVASMIKDEKKSLIKEYQSALVKYVIDSDTKGFKLELLDSSADDDVKKFGESLLYVLENFYKKYKEQRETNSIENQKILKLKKCFDEYIKTGKKPEIYPKELKFNIKKNFFKTSDIEESYKNLPADESIDPCKVDENIDDFLNLLVFVTNLKDVKTMTRELMKPKEYTAFRNEFDRWFDYGVRRAGGSCRREWLSKKSLCKRALEYDISFQGKLLKVKEIVKEDTTLLTPDLLTSVFCRQYISVGRPPPEFSETKHYYISRKLVRENNDNKHEFFNENDLINDKLTAKKRMWIITGEPGIGKTCFTVNIARMFAANFEKYAWIINIPLNAIKRELKMLTTDNHKNVIEFFMNIEECEGIFCSELLRQSIFGTHPIRILLDGLDEISEIEQASVIDLIEFLRDNSQVDQIWLTARTHLQVKLEQSLKERAFALEELEESDQVSLLVKYWKHNSKQRNEDKLRSFGEKLVEKIRANIDRQWLHFLGIPLQAYMVAFIFCNKVESENIVIPDVFNLISLYEEFVEEKFEVYFRKEHLDGQEAWFKQNMKDNCQKGHQYMAIIYGEVIFMNEEELRSFFGHSLPSRSEITALLKIGIVFERKNELYFIHKTFAEYFIAKLFADVCKLDYIHRKKSECLLVIRNGLNLSHIILLRLFFDLKITEDLPLPFAVLKGALDKIMEWDREEINKLDYAGRSLLYYALHYEHENILDHLFERKISINLNDNFFSNCWITMWSHSEWNVRGFLQLYNRVKFAFYALANEDKIIDFDPNIQANKYNYGKHDFLKSAKRQIEEGQKFVQEMTCDLTEITPEDLPNKIKELNYKPLPLLNAHIYFETNSEFLLNVKESKLYEILDSAEVLAQIEIIAKAKFKAMNISRKLVDAFLNYKYTEDRPYSILETARKRCRNLYILLETFIVHKLPLHYDRYWFDKNIYPACIILIQNSPSYIHDILEPLKEMYDEIEGGKISADMAELITKVWMRCQKELPNLNDRTVCQAVQIVVRGLMDYNNAHRLISLRSSLLLRIQDSILCADHNISPYILEAKELGFLELILYSVDEEGTTIRELIRNKFQEDDISAILQKLKVASDPMGPSEI